MSETSTLPGNVIEITDADYRRNKQLEINQQNYQIACGLGAAADAVKLLSDSGIAIHSVAIADNFAYMQTDSARKVPGIKIIGTVTRANGTMVRALLLGSVLEWGELL